MHYCPDCSVKKKMFLKWLRSPFCTQMSDLFFICILSSVSINFVNLLGICFAFITLKFVHLFLCIMLLIIKATKFLSSFGTFLCSGLFQVQVSLSSIYSGRMVVKCILNRPIILLVTLQDRTSWWCSVWLLLHKLQIAPVCN